MQRKKKSIWKKNGICQSSAKKRLRFFKYLVVNIIVRMCILFCCSNLEFFCMFWLRFCFIHILFSCYFVILLFCLHYGYGHRFDSSILIKWAVLTVKRQCTFAACSFNSIVYVQIPTWNVDWPKGCIPVTYRWLVLFNDHWLKNDCKMLGCFSSRYIEKLNWKIKRFRRYRREWLSLSEI